MHSSDTQKVQQEWDTYWQDKKISDGWLYDVLAGWYRRCFIKNALDHFMRKHFKPGQRLLHAGCGSGQVDVDIARWADITALDLSPQALNIYRRSNGDRCRVMQGNIFDIPAERNSFDGVYNLGVMEHFFEDDIQKILGEFHRVLKPSGKLVIFWPPAFGAFARVSDALHFTVNKVFKNKNFKLHPDEVTRIRSRQHAFDIFTQANFRVEEYYFGPRDLFTQCVIVATKMDTKA